MLKQCLVCKVVGAIAIIGAINWGLIAVANFNLVEHFFGIGTQLTRVIYGLVGVSGVLLLAGYFGMCPACKK